MFKRTACVVIFLLMIGVSTFAQGTIDKYGNFHATEEQLAKNKRMGELLRNPTFITLRLASFRRDHPPEEPSTTPSPYTVGDHIHFELFLTQNSTEDIEITSSFWPYAEFRPELIRDGDIVPYSKEAQRLVDRSDKDRWSGSSTTGTLVPGREYGSDYVKLEDWYESPFKPGHYQLVVRKRFTLTGDWVQSNPVTFDVIASKSGEQSALKLILTDRKEKHTFGDEIRFQQKIENESDGQAGIEGFDFYYQNRPKLLRDGTAVPYQSKTADLVRSKETDPGGLFISVRLAVIEPHSTRNFEELDLADWYDVLQPGSYKLTDKYRISFDGPWTKESAEMQFRIEPKN